MLLFTLILLIYFTFRWPFIVCLSVRGFTSHSRIFHQYGDVILIGKGLQILNCTRQSWPLSCESSLACHPFIIVISEDAGRLAVELSLLDTTCFYDIYMSWLGFEQPIFRMRGEGSNRLRCSGGRPLNYCPSWHHNTPIVYFWFHIKVSYRANYWKSAKRLLI